MIDQLKSDLDRIMLEDLPALVANPEPAAIAAHLQNTLYPILGQVAEEIEEIDDAVEDLGADAEDILQPESAEAIGVVLIQGAIVVAELKKRLSIKTDAALLRVCLEFERQLKAATEVLREVYVPAADADAEEQDDGKDDDGAAAEDPAPTGPADGAA